jgi:hypothetical protein
VQRGGQPALSTGSLGRKGDTNLADALLFARFVPPLRSGTKCIRDTEPILVPAPHNLWWTKQHQTWLQRSRHPPWTQCHATRPQLELHRCQTAWPVGCFDYIFPLVFSIIISYVCLEGLEGLEAWVNRFPHGAIPCSRCLRMLYDWFFETLVLDLGG